MRSPTSFLLLLAVPSAFFAAAGCSAQNETADDPSRAASAALDTCKVECANNVDCLLEDKIENDAHFNNANGQHEVHSTLGGKNLATDNAYFKSIGSNGRACVSCHGPEDGFGLSAASVRKRFEISCGTDAVFRTVDGSNSPTADTSSLAAKRSAYSLLLNKGLIRLKFPVPANAEFELVSVDDPYNNDLTGGINVFRRPLPATNLRFLNVIMWDAREPSLQSQARNATLRHAEAGSAPSDATLDSIVAFETSTFTSQVKSNTIGQLSTDGAAADPITLSNQPFIPFANAFVVVPAPPNDTTAFPPNFDVFTVYASWTGNSDAKKQSVARGEVLFNTKHMTITTLPGLGVVTGTCTTCHSAANAGGSDILVPVTPAGLHNIVRVSDAEFRTPDLPLYTFRVKQDTTTNTGNFFAAGQLVQTTDPGLALQTGSMSDFGSFKAPNLRGISGRAPYFHNGKAATLGDVVDHYDNVMKIGLTSDEKTDLTNFLQTL